MDYFLIQKVSKSGRNSAYLSYHLCLVRLASKDTFTALSQITLYARQTGSSSRSTKQPRFLPWEFDTEFGKFTKLDFTGLCLYISCLFWEGFFQLHSDV